MTSPGTRPGSESADQAEPVAPQDLGGGDESEPEVERLLGTGGVVAGAVGQAGGASGTGGHQHAAGARLLGEGEPAVARRGAGEDLALHPVASAPYEGVELTGAGRVRAAAARTA